MLHDDSITYQFALCLFCAKKIEVGVNMNFRLNDVVVLNSFMFHIYFIYCTLNKNV